MSELEKPFLKKNQIKKLKKKIRYQNAACEQNTTSEKWKFGSQKKLGLEWAINGLGKPFRKNPIQKIEKTVKIKVKLPHVDKKPLARKRNFVQTPFLNSTFKLERKKIHAAKPLAFSLHFLFRRDQNHHSNLTSKIMKMCEQILKKK